MDEFIKNYILTSELSDNFKQAFLSLFNKYQDKYGYLKIGEAGEIIANLQTLDKDLKNFDCNFNTYMAFVYCYAKRYCVNDYKDENGEDISLWDRMFRILINNTIMFEDKRKYFMELDNPQNDVVRYLKKVAILFDELLTLVFQNKEYLAVKKYHELIELCNRDGLDESLLEKGNEKELLVALEKKYSLFSPLRNPIVYRNQVNKRKVIKEKDFAPYNFVCYETINTLSYMLLKLIHSSLMREFYFRTGYFIRPYNRDINLYFLDDLVVVAYRYDDVPTMVLLDNQTILTWNDPGFWGTIFNFKKDFENKGQNKHYIEELNKKYIIEPITFKDSLFRTLGKNVIFAPEKYLDEAVFKYAIVNKCLDKYQEAGLNTNNITNKLLTCNYQFYFKDPTLVDELEVENLGDYKYLEMIRAADATGEERKRTIAGIKGLMKKNPQKVVSVDTSKSNQRQLSFEPRLPYKN